LAGGLAGAGAACAQDLAAKQAFARGDFLIAAELAEKAGAADDLAFSARALLAETVTGDEPVADLLKRAERNARLALAKDSGDVEARLQWAAAVGMLARSTDLPLSTERGYARRGKKMLEEAIRLAPQEAWAHAFLGCWNFEVVRRGGSAGALVFGASRAAGRRAFTRALQLAPGDPAIAYQYAVVLLESDPHRNAEEARRLLDIASHAAPRDAFERLMAQKARAVGHALRNDGPVAAVQAATRRFS
jgi:tetratricopeptide (TPR) repeat protein